MFYYPNMKSTGIPRLQRVTALTNQVEYSEFDQIFIICLVSAQTQNGAMTLSRACVWMVPRLESGPLAAAGILNYLHPGDYVFQHCLFVGCLVSQQHYIRTPQQIPTRRGWNDWTWAKNEPSTFWCRSFFSHFSLTF